MGFRPRPLRRAAPWDVDVLDRPEGSPTMESTRVGSILPELVLDLSLWAEVLRGSHTHLKGEGR